MARETLRIVIDTNEFVFALTGPAGSASHRMMELLLSGPGRFDIRVPQIVVAECARNLPAHSRPQFFALLNALASVDPDYVVPFEAGERYRVFGMKPADALIAAYCEWIEADALVTENRHFLVQYRLRLPFHVLTAEGLLEQYGA